MEIINLGVFQMIFAYVFVLLLLILVKIKGISREKEILISSIRMTLQLILSGYVLGFLFENTSPVYTLVVLLIMLIFSIHNIIKRVKTKVSKKLKEVIAISMSVGTLSCLFYFLIVIININPLYDSRYFIPIAGMLIGNSMTGISLGINVLASGMENQKNLVENALMLGATPKVASKEIVDNAFDSAIMPTINSMVGMGIVFLPGMMTGQILSGVSPMVAIEYQIAIMLGILGSVTLTTLIFLKFGYKTYFNKENQFIE